MTRSRSRTLLIVVGVAVAALGAGVVAGSLITSPADAAARAEPPEASEVTVPVERRTLETRVVTRGDASYTGAVDVDLEFPGVETKPIVTGQVPDVGDEVDAGDVLLEVIGRPVVVLPGKIPMYRALRPGMSGPDVEQLEEALAGLGYDPGTVDENYTNATGRAVAEVFEDAGYEAPPVDPDVQAELAAAEDAVDMAEDEVTGAEGALRATSQGPGEVEQLSAQNEVDRAERDLKSARQDGDSAAIADAEAQLKLAEAQQRDLLKGPDTSAEQAMLDAARQRLHDARSDRDAAAATAGTPLPAAEVVFVPSLPRRVDEVNVSRGDEVSETVMSISGADLVVHATVDTAARELIDDESEAILQLPDDDEVSAPITAIDEASGDDSGYELTITPADLSADQVEALRSANVRVTIPVASTDGEVLAVPLAALTAGSGGEARVEVQRDAATDGAPATELIEVEVGLSADGYAEITPTDGDAELAEGDLVVVGQQDSSTAEQPTADPESSDDS